MGKLGKGVTLVDEKSIFIGEDVVIGDGVTIYENNRLEGKTVIGDGCVLLPNNYLKDAVFGKNCTVHFSVAESAQVEDGVSVGPFARLRPKAYVKSNAKIGNFVEIKNAVIGEGTKVSHLAYVGDADVGENCNIGCGVIFVNYNGKSKSRSVVGDNCFIGSNCNVVAPVTIEKNSYICAGTTVTEDVNSDAFVIGRVRQEVKENRAHEYLKEVR
ncbi:MAG: hypothetical protein IJ506_04430 [Clostridia bacterium]|nr:hypothetical protein [Clostridia bacterium]